MISHWHSGPEALNDTSVISKSTKKKRKKKRRTEVRIILVTLLRPLHTSHLLSDSALLMLLRFCSTVFLGGLFFFGCLAVTSPPASPASSPSSSVAPWPVYAQGIQKKQKMFNSTGRWVQQL